MWTWLMTHIASVTASAALALGIFNFFHTVYLGRRDRAKPIATSKHLKFLEEDGQQFPEQVRFAIVNIGRRPIIITSLNFLHDNGAQHGHAFDHPKGRTLTEQERIQIEFEMLESPIYNVEDDSIAVDAWFIDTQGRKHHVKDAKKTLAALVSKSETKK